MSVTRNLKLRLSSELTADARFNLERIDQLGTVFPITNTGNQTINSSGAIRLNANSTKLGGDGKGTVFVPKLNISTGLVLESGPYTLSVNTGSQTSNISLTLPVDDGTAGQFLETDGTGTLSWGDPPTSNFETLNDTTFTNLLAGQVAQYNGSKWVNATLPNTRNAGVFTWIPAEGVNKTITHNFNSDKITIWIYEAESKSQVFVNDIDYLDLNTILLSAHSVPDSDYLVHLIQTA